MNASVSSQRENRFFQYPLEDAFVWLDTAVNQVRVTNAVGALILTNRHCSIEHIADIVCAEYHVSRDQAMADIQQALAEMDKQQQQDEDTFHANPYTPSTSFIPHRPCNTKVTSHLYLPKVCITVNSELENLPAYLEPLFKLSEHVTAISSPLTLDVYDEGSTFPIVYRGKTLDTGLSLSDTAMKCQREINNLLTTKEPFLIRLHAAAVARDNRGILFPAVGGSGKSTLSAYLMSRGYQYLNDDTVPLLAGTRQLAPVPVSLSVKSGSWPILSKLFPELEALRSYDYDDRHVKYLPVHDHQICTSPVDCRLIVLPSFSFDHHTTALEEISPLSAFQHFTTSGCIIEKPIKPKHLEMLVNWISEIPCYRLRYSSLEEAADALDSLIATTTLSCD